MQNYIQFMIHTKHFLKGGFNAVSYVRCLCGFAETKKQNILTDPCDWIVKQRLVKQISSYKDVDFFFSTSISVMNFKGTFKSTIHPAYQARGSQSIFGSGLEEGAPLKRKLWGGEQALSVVIHMDFWLGLTRQISLFVPKLSPTASAFLPLFSLPGHISPNIRLTEPLSAPHLLL